MTRLFDTHIVRDRQSLDGDWDYVFPAAGTEIQLADVADGVVERLVVPGVWEMLPSRVNYRGQAVARREFVAPQAGPARLVFKGVSHTTTVYLDGEPAGQHHNAYTAFTVDIASLSAGRHELALHITNEHGALSALHVPNDYYNYGGISRPAEVQFLHAPVFVRHVHVVTAQVDGQWQAQLTAVVRNLGAATTVDWQAELAGATTRVADIACATGDTTVTATLTPDAVTPWSPTTPQLYMLDAQLLRGGAAIDDWRDRIGFRTVTLDGEQILLNGKRIVPVGFNRHEDHPDYGCAIPVDAMRQDLRIFRDLNANAVRTCHYPNDERFLDLCDEQGFLVWEENHARGLNMEPMQHPLFREQCAACNEEMVREHYNRPSIVMWGLLNECESGSEEGAALYQEQITQLRELDNTRPITFASCRHERDLCQGMIDICGWNMYPKWYGHLPPLQFLDELIARMEPVGMAGKPLIVSEFGAGGIPGYRDPIRRAKWSEERQADVLDLQLSAIVPHPRVGGIFLWQFCDVRVDDDWAMHRPRTMNNKGVVDEHRRPKLVYDTVKKWFAKVTQG